jgi:hypothetical protein
LEVQRGEKQEMILQTVVREACRRHGVTEAEILHPRGSARVSRARKEVAQALKLQHGWSYGQVARVLRCTRPAVLKLTRQPAPEPDLVDKVESLELSLRRYLGLDLAPEISAKTGLGRSFSLWLSLLVEAYPRTLSTDTMLSMYEHAAELSRMETGDLNENSVRVAVLRIRRHFSDIGLADPVETVSAGGYRLAAGVASWMAANFGRPANVVFEKSVNLAGKHHA